MKIDVQFLSNQKDVDQLALHLGLNNLPSYRKFSFGWKYYLREVKLRYMFADISFLGLIKETIKSILYDLLFLPIPTLLFAISHRVYEIEYSSLQYFHSIYQKSPEIFWISRQAIIDGMIIGPIDDSIDFNFLRHRSFNLFRVWSVEKTKLLDSSSTFRFTSAICNYPEIEYEGDWNRFSEIEIEKVEVHHGQYIVKNRHLIPLDFSQLGSSASWPSIRPIFFRDETYLTDVTLNHELSEAIFIPTSESWYHFLVESLPRYLQIPQYLRTLPIILSPTIGRQIKEVLRHFSFQNIKFSAPLESFALDHVYTVPDFRFRDPFDFSLRSEDLRKLQEHFSNIEERRIDCPKRILIARPASLFRKMKNFAELCTSLKGHGFVVVSPENLGFYDQLSLFRHADIIIGQSGAALTSMLFCNKGATVIELGNWDVNNQQFFWRKFGRELGLSVSAVPARKSHPLHSIKDDFLCDIDGVIQLLQNV